MAFRGADEMYMGSEGERKGADKEIKDINGNEGACPSNIGCF